MSPWKAVHLEVRPAHRLFVRFADGSEGTVDAEARIAAGHCGNVFDVLVDQFDAVGLERGVITWPGQIDLAPDTVWAAIREQGVYRLTP